jgi:pimeloyl-ACP methyl ester carboxylesterase
LPARATIARVAARALTLPDGRTIAVHEGGDPAGAAIVVHHGTPSCGLLHASWTASAAERGLRLVGLDRAGYGGSTRLAGRAVAQAAADTLAVADALGIDRFATWGISGGGPHALACAALCGERVVAAASLAGIAPWGADGLDWLAGMGEANLEEFDLALTGEEVLRPALEDERVQMLAATPATLLDGVASLVGEADRAALSGPLGVWLYETMVVGLPESVAGWVDDDLAFTADWGFDLARIERPVLVVHGADDRFVPIAHGRWLAERIPGAVAWLDDDNGHLTLLERRVLEVHDWLRERF